jgi:hypothetical protein
MPAIEVKLETKSIAVEGKKLKQPEFKQSHPDSNYITYETEVDAVPIGANY